MNGSAVRLSGNRNIKFVFDKFRVIELLRAK
jgi:hypothetical protein